MNAIATEKVVDAPSEPVNLIRSTPPRAPGLSEAISKALSQIATKGIDSGLIRSHRFDGTDRDKEVASTWLSDRFMQRLETGRIILTNGAQSAMMLALVRTVPPGETLLVEELSYHGLRKIARLLGIQVAAIAMDEEGARPDAFEDACRRLSPKGLFLMPTLHNPTTAIMSEERRLAIADLARRYGVVVIEDDVYGLLPAESPRPFAALAADITWQVTSFAKCLGPGLRVGYLVAPDGAAAQETVRYFQGVSTWFVAPTSAEFAAQWVCDGTMERLSAEVRKEAAARQVMAQQELSGQIFETKPESLFLWLTLPDHWPVDDFVVAMSDAGVIIRPGHSFAEKPEQARNSVRIVIGSPETREQLKTGLTSLSHVLESRRV